MDYQKRASRRLIPVDDTYFLTTQTSDPSPENQCLEQEVREKLLACCRQLKSSYQEIAIDYFYHEMEVKEIARKTGKNIKTIQTQIYRAKAMLRTLYKRGGYLT